MNQNVCDKLTKLNLNNKLQEVKQTQMVSVSVCITYFVKNSNQVQQYKDKFGLNKFEFYELQFSKKLIDFLYYLKECDGGLTGFWFSYFFKYCLSFPNYSDHRITKLENDLSRQNTDHDNDQNEISLINQIHLDPEKKENFINQFLDAFRKNQQNERLTLEEHFDISLAHPIYKNRKIDNAGEFRRRLREFKSEFLEEIEQFKTIWEGIEVNLEYTYNDCLIGHPRLKIKNEILEIKLNSMKPDDFTIFRALTYAFMSKERIDFINVLQPLTNKIYTWNISHITKEHRENFLQMLSNRSI